MLYCVDAALWVSVFMEEVLKHKEARPSLWTFFYNPCLVKKFQRLNSSGSSTVFHPLLVYVPVTYRAGVFAQVGEGYSFWMRDWGLPSHLCSPHGLSLSEQCPRARPGRCVRHVQFAVYGRFTVSIQEASWQFLYPLFKRRINLCFTGLQVSNTTRINLSCEMHFAKRIQDPMLWDLAFLEFQTWTEGPLL